ncbi:adenylosuccinate synthase [Candidatus Micrarchaeota archaeon]|nr:adenylosuccinate synthase [Candidatus Micrarchaeota archaeon]
MAVALIVGLQWGDEGKGKIVDLFARDYDYIVRFNGGDNAGHTVIKGNEEFKLHLLPSGIFYPEKFKVIGNGLVVNPETLGREIDEVEKRNYSLAKFLLSSDAHLIMKWHQLMDGTFASKKIGTTKKGIGPAYSDKASRTFALRACDLLLPEEELRKKIETIASHEKTLFSAFGIPEFDAKEVIDTMLQASRKLVPYIADTQFMLNRAVRDKKNILLEGAQGTMLDIDHGTFPYVTSSNATAGAACTGTGIPPNSIDRIVGIAKAYTTRVGKGPFPTELQGKEGNALRTAGNEFGTTTGRPRRCGWLDLVVLKFACMVNGVTETALTKLDVLSGLDEIKVCTSYQLDGSGISDFPLQPEKLARAVPVYENLKGWKKDISGCRTMEGLPQEAADYIGFLQNKLGVPIKTVSVGPKREQTIAPPS